MQDGNVDVRPEGRGVISAQVIDLDPGRREYGSLGGLCILCLAIALHELSRQIAHLFAQRR